MKSSTLELEPRDAASQVVLDLDDRAVEQIAEAVLHRLSAAGVGRTIAGSDSGAAQADAPKRRTVDTKTRYEGIYARHRLLCPKALDSRRLCRCNPSFYGLVWEPVGRRHRRTKRRARVRDARRLRETLLVEVSEETAALRARAVPLEQVAETFLEDCKKGVALNKHGEPYKPKAITNLKSSLNSLPPSIRGKPLIDITGGELQRAIDDFRRRNLSSSRIHSIINAVRSLYTWAIYRELAVESPATRLRLPVIRARARARIAKPRELTLLLDPLGSRDALPFAIAAYATARLQEIQILEWPQVDLEAKTILLADSEDARKSDAAWRIVPVVNPLRKLLETEWRRQGEPKAGRVCSPRRQSKSGQISLNQLSKRVAKIWKKLGFDPIGFQDCRHTAATWLDHAGVPPKVVSVIMGHKALNRGLHPDAAPITQRRYTHVLEGEIERAGATLGAYLAEREAEEREA